MPTKERDVDAPCEPFQGNGRDWYFIAIGYPNAIVKVPIKGRTKNGVIKYSSSWNLLMRRLARIYKLNHWEFSTVDSLFGCYGYTKLRAEDERLAARVELAYAGDVSILPEFCLIEWDSDLVDFKLMRNTLEVTDPCQQING